jgi:glycosyltransferase involved in cell wall biosynthesis
MKLLVFAHTPPPHHGQSFMVQVMLEAFGGDQRKRKNRKSGRSDQFGIECYHVNARVSKQLGDIGDPRMGKFGMMLGYCAQAIWCRFRYGVTNFYYVPAPGKKSALYRDWLVLALCRPFFKHIILHWHASGLAKWLETIVQLRSRSITYLVAGQADLSIVLSNYGRADADKLYARNVAIVGNGLADPCPSFREELLPIRKARLQARQKLMAGEDDKAKATTEPGDPWVFKVLFVSHCSRDKGLFETIEGVLFANETLRKSGSPIRMQLTIAGEFLHRDEKAEFERITRDPAVAAQIRRVGFVSGDEKHQLYKEADVFCFPSHLESFGLVLAESMAYGLPMVATRCGALPEVLPPEYPGLVNVRSGGEVGRALLQSMSDSNFEALRDRYEQNFTLGKHLDKLAAALKLIDGESPRLENSTLAKPARVAG